MMTKTNNKKEENKMVEKMSREDLEMEILKNDDLYEIFDEERLLGGTYTDEELIVNYDEFE